ncbi:M24 family metallopeptidase [Dermatobacter hominis]|uniref:M24 family metallopeptidase n=1 Tax=Dermatobacter hominis TaxID=2884263 RepID=UPI001D1012BF|nr:Xaa-Pro peptidase family protein [Dermatobacter hominis]UDY35546.1 Xaa-Pro peptidase family protein [Dermatobacter hominis]
MPGSAAAASPFAERLARVRTRMAALGVDVLAISVGPDLPWLCGYEAMPLERLTMLVVPVDGDATLVVPGLEAPRVHERPELFSLRPWGETEDPVAIVADLVGTAATVAIGDRTWARFVIDLQHALPDARLRRAADVTVPLRAVKDDAELAALRAASAAADRVAAQLQAGDVALVGRTEADVSAELGRRLLAEGHQRVNFAIVAAGEDAASPHHEPGDRLVGPDEVVLCDFGGTMADAHGVGYCSDITRCVWTGEPPAEAAEVYAVLRAAQQAAFEAVGLGVAAENVDAAARRVIEAAGYGDRFVHRTGHGIGVEEHEDPYVVDGNGEPLVAGNAFSIEPGIYLPGRFGFRLEDIVAVTGGVGDRLNHADRELVPL